MLRYLFTALIFAYTVSAHGAPSPAQVEHHRNVRRAFGSCFSHLQKRGNDGELRRAAFVERYREQKRRKLKRQEPTPTTQRNIATGTNTASPFSGIPTCVLAPESVQGPYYLPNELIRDDIRESEPGVDLLLDVQIFDAKSCRVLPGVMLDVWHANSTGVYSGYAREGTSGSSWLRGVAESDDEGVVQVTTKWPGHYDGRAIHIHVMAHINGSRTDDGTYVGARHPFVGQIFFPMDTIDEIEEVAPYSRNPARLIRNDQDRIFRDANESVEGYDGLADVRKLGDDVEDGYMAWISIGIDTSRNHDTGFDEESTSGGSSGNGGGSSSGNTVGSPSRTVSAPATTTTAGADIVRAAVKGAMAAGLGAALVAMIL